MYKHKILLRNMHKDKIREIYKITEYKGNSVYKTKLIGYSIESEYAKIPNNVNMLLSTGLDVFENENKTIDILSYDEIISICGYKS